MKTRIIIALAFLIGSVISLYLVYGGRVSPETAGILANLGTGFIGTALTVLIVDWLYERRSSEEQCRAIALSVLLELDHAIWVWQGDGRGFNVDELYSRIHDASRDDPIPFFTQNLFMILGSRCVTQLNLKREDLARQPKLIEVLNQLSTLQLIRDRYFDFPKLQATLASVVPPLASVCGIQAPRIIELSISAHRISSKEHQHYRHFGRQIDGAEQPIWYPELQPNS